MESLASQLVRQTGDMAVPITSSRSVRLPSDDGNIPVAAVLDFQRHQPFRVVKCKQHPLVILHSAKLMFKSILRRVVFEFRSNLMF